MKFKLVFLSLLFVLGTSFTAKAGPAPDSFADLAEKLLPTVVNISTTQKVVELDPQTMPEVPQFPEGSPFQDFFKEFMDRHQNMMPEVPPASLGSGFIIDAENGYIITNNHVVRGAENIRVTLHDDKTIEATMVGVDEKTDIAVIKVDPKDVKDVVTVSFGNSDTLRVGDWVVAIGNPFGLGGTVTAGIISARQRDINAGPYDDFIQTDASINRGNSGGPMFNLAGEIIGINTAIFSPTGGSVGIGFAIPSNLAKPVVDQLIKYGRTRRGWLGVRIQNVTDEIADSLGMSQAYGALVASPTEGSPATIAGVKAGDVIIEFDGKRIDQMRDLPRIVAETEIGRKVKVVVWRDNSEKEFTIEIAELEKAEDDGLLETSSNDMSEQTPSSEVLLSDEGFGISPLNDETRSRYGIDSSLNGVVVSNIERDSAVIEKGIIVGDVITEADQKAVSSPEELEKVFADLKAAGKKTALLLINSGGDMRFVAISIGKKEK